MKSSALLHCAWAAVNWVPAPPGFMYPASMIFFSPVNTSCTGDSDQQSGFRFSRASRTSSPPCLIAEQIAMVW